VQVNNQEALDFYLKHGFENVGTIENYYKKIDPPDCFIVRKRFVHVNMGGGVATGAVLD
jgi:ribosomal protein S18 acetylase RimI-like enzyme